MEIVERDLYAEAEGRLGRPLSEGERLIDLEANDRVLEEAKAALHEAIEKEKRRQIRAFLDGREPQMRITPEMTDIIVRVRLAGMDAAEAELARADPTRKMAGFSQFFVDYNATNGWFIADELGNVYEAGFGHDTAAMNAALSRLGVLINAGEAPVAAAASKSLTAEIEERYPGWVWDAGDKLFVPKREPLRTAYKALYGQGGVVQGDTNLGAASRAQGLIDAGMDRQLVADALQAHALGLRGEGFEPTGWQMAPDQAWVDKFIRRDLPGFSDAISPEDVRGAIDAGVKPPAWKTGPPKAIVRWGPGSTEKFRVGIPMPNQASVDAVRKGLIAEGIIGPRPVNPAQMLLFDPQMDPLMEAFKMQMRGISKRISKEGNAQLIVNQDAGVQALARAIDKQVPGALDAAGRMVSGPFNQGLGDVFKLKGGLFKRWQYSAVMDRATCEVCKYFDGTIYFSWRAIAELPTSPLPGGGPNPGCFGDQRCRCRPVPYFGPGRAGDVEPTLGGSPGTISLDDENTLLGKGDVEDLQRNGMSGSSASYTGYVRDVDGKRFKAQIKPEGGLYSESGPWEYPKDRIHEAIREGGDVDHERAAYQLSSFFQDHKGIELHTPEARLAHVHITDDYYGIDQMDKSIVSRWLGDHTNPSEPMYLGDASDDEIRGIGIYDAVIGQHDRHGDNFLHWDGKLWAIDNGLAFPEYNDGNTAWNMETFNEYLNRFGPEIDEDGMNLLNDLWKKKDEIDRELPWLGSDEKAAMWDRVERMIDSGNLVGPNGDTL